MVVLAVALHLARAVERHVLAVTEVVNQAVIVRARINVQVVQAVVQRVAAVVAVAAVAVMAVLMAAEKPARAAMCCVRVIAMTVAMMPAEAGAHLHAKAAAQAALVPVPTGVEILAPGTVRESAKTVVHLIAVQRATLHVLPSAGELRQL